MATAIGYAFACRCSRKSKQWYPVDRRFNMGSSKQKAKTENKFVFVDAYATWCGPCKKMDKEVYTDQMVGELVNSKFISVKLQMDKTNNDDDRVKSWLAVARSFESQFQIDGYPSFYFFHLMGNLP